MNWRLEVKRGGVMEHQANGNIPDPAWAMGIAAHAEGTPKATIEMRVVHWGEHVSVSASVSLECPQSVPYMEAAGELALVTATRFMNEAVSRFDSSMPLLPTGG